LPIPDFYGTISESEDTELLFLAEYVEELFGNRQINVKINEDFELEENFKAVQSYNYIIKEAL
jgi:hypothetical protein